MRSLDCKTVRIFAYSSTREQSNKRSGMKLKTESETGEVMQINGKKRRRDCGGERKKDACGGLFVLNFRFSETEIPDFR